MTKPTAIPATATYVAYHAATAPAQVAVVEDGRRIAYGKFHRDLGRMVGHLRGLGVGPGQTVGVEINGCYVHWLILLACEALGAATLSYLRDEGALLAGHLAALDRVFCSAKTQPAGATAVHVLDPTWLEAVAAQPEEALSSATAVDPDAPLRLVKSYGTTGILETMVHTGRSREFWVRQFQLRAGFDRRSRYLASLRFTVEAIHVHATACLRMGGTCVFDEAGELAARLDRHAISHATLLPGALESLVRAPAVAPAARLRTVFTIGAPVSRAVREASRRLLADEVSESYGTNEVGGICSVDDDGVGTAFPGVAVEVVDERDAPVLGVPGRVRVRSDGMVDGFRDDPAATARMFRDGWFYPGDLGVMPQPNRLRLLGRIEDFVEIRGIRHGLADLERSLQGAVAAADLCLLDDSGAGRVALILVAAVDRPDDLRGLDAAARACLPAGIDGLQIVGARSIPRTTGGGVQRAKLKWQVRQTLNGAHSR